MTQSLADGVGCFKLNVSFTCASITYIEANNPNGTQISLPAHGLENSMVIPQTPIASNESSANPLSDPKPEHYDDCSFQELLEACGYGAIALSNGVSPYEVSKQLGNSVAMLMKHYAKWMKRDDSGVASMFARSKLKNGRRE